jgi:hypothetical protein
VTCFVFDTGHGDILEAAGDDGIKSGQIAADIDREAVHGDPPTHADADGRYLPIFHPDAGEAVTDGRLDAMGDTRGDEGEFKRSKIAVKIASKSREIENRITDQLAGAVVGCLAAAIDFYDGVGESGIAAEAGAIPGATDGVDGFVLEEEDRIGYFSKASLLGEF